MNILIVAHKQVTRPGEYYNFPLGIAYISAALKQGGFRVHCLNLNHHEDHLAALLRTVKETGTDIVCMGGLSAHFGQIAELLTLIKQHAPQVITIVGGGLVTSEPVMVYDLLRPDYGVIGEGEETIVQLVRALEQKTSVADIDGLVYRNAKTGNTTVTKHRKLIQNIDQIPFPDFAGFEIDRYIDSQRPNDLYYFHSIKGKPRMLPIISSRGCPYNCSFCFHPLGRQYRVRSLDNFFAELEQLMSRYDINYFCVYDELLSANKQRIQEFCHRMETYNVRWMTQLRVDSVDEDLLKALKRAGLTMISYGIESASNSVLKSMGKAITIEQVDRVLAMTRKNSIGFEGNLIFGDRAETEESVAQAFAWNRKHSDYFVGMGMIVPYPGSPLYHHAKEKGLIPDLKGFLASGGGVLNVTAIPDARFRRLAFLAYARNVRAQMKHRIRPLRIERTGKNELGMSLYTFTVLCRHCNTTTTYTDFNVGQQQGCLLVCRSCNQRHYISFDRFKDYMNLALNTIAANMPVQMAELIHRIAGLPKKLLSSARSGRDGST